VYVQYPKTEGVPGCTVVGKKLEVRVDESNLAAFLDDAGFANRLKQHIASLTAEI
jgi:hypothetical protein